MAASQPGDIFQPGDLLNNTYRIELILGRGGTSEVYKARSEISGRVMAVKALRAEFASNEDFLVLMTREEDIRDIRHDAIVRYFDTQRMPDGVVYLVMDYVEGPALDKKMLDGGMPASDLLQVGERVCEGLIAAHDRNIVHRDLSPDNIILRDGKPGEAVIIDFGIAKDTNPGAMTIVGNEFAGKYAYAAPEQLSGKTDPRSDIYSLGALLLSTFRGKKPDVGRNPMEVVENKRKPLDVEGVPEPLRSLISRMTDPDPDRRFGSAKELLEAFRHPEALVKAAPSPPEGEVLDDSTVITAPPARAEAPVGIPESKPAAPSSPAKQKGRGGLIGAIFVLVLVAAAAGGYFGGLFDGLLGPKYPVADPYHFAIERGIGGDTKAVGDVPSPEIKAAVDKRLAAMGASGDLTLATGKISDGWGKGLLAILDSTAKLEEFSVMIQNDRAKVTGIASSRSDFDAVKAAFANGLPVPFQGTSDFKLGPRFLTAKALQPVLASHADCGDLQLQSPPPVGYSFGDRIIVTGRFASDATRQALQTAISDIAGTRPVRIEGETLNPSLCKIDALLPSVPSGGFDIRFAFGDRTGPNPSGVYKVGDNPVIDVRLPNDVKDGYLWVSVVDVEGVVFHLLPNRIRPKNDIASLKSEVQNGYVRVAYALKEAQANGKLAFNVDGSVLGKSMVMVLYSKDQLFPDLRPTTESAASYAEAISEVRAKGGLQVTSMDTAILTTEQK